MKYILSIPLRFIGLSICVLIIWMLTLIGSIILILWHFEFKWYYAVKEYCWGTDYYFLTIDFGKGPYCYKTFWDVVFNRKT